MGSPNALAGPNLINLAVLLPAAAFGTGFAIRLAVLVPFVAAAIGMAFACARMVSASPLCAAGAALAYVTAPVLLNNLGAGHVAFWYAYAMLPLAALLSFESARRPDRPQLLVGLCLLGSLITVQPQFAAFGLTAVVAGAIVANARRSWIPGLFFLAGALVSLLPVFVALDSAREYLPLLYPRPQIGWERLLSTPWPDVMWTTRYVVPYYARATGGTLYLQLFGIVALASILVVRPLRVAGGLALLVLIGFFFANGVFGPAHAIWSYLYTSFYPATAFRDASSGAALISLAYAIAVGASSRRLYVAVPLLATLAVASLPFLFGATGSIVHNVVMPGEPAIRRAIATIQPGRIASSPLVAPVVFKGTDGGVDVDAVADAQHPSLAEYPTLPPLTNVATGDSDQAWLADALSRMGVVAFVQRRDFWNNDLIRQGVRSPPPQVTTLRRIASKGIVVFATATAPEPLSYRTHLRSDVTGVDSPAGPLQGTDARARLRVVDLADDSGVGDDPRIGWALLTRWYGLDRSDSTEGVGVITRSPAPLALPVPAGTWWLLHSGGPIVVSSGSVRNRLVESATPRWDVIQSGARTTIRSTGAGAVVYRAAVGRAANVPIGRFGTADVESVHRWVPWRVDIRIRSASRGPWLLVFRERYARGWTVPNAPVRWHGVADGYANAFLLDSLPHELSVCYQPQHAFGILCGLVWFVQLGLVLFCVSGRRRADEKASELSSRG